MVANLCPKCFEPTQDPMGYICAVTSCDMYGAAQSELEVKRDDEERPICIACEKLLQSRICLACGYLLADEDPSGNNLPLSIIGAQGVGKSNYLSVLLDRVKVDMSKVYDCALYPLGGDTTMNLYEEHYHHPLFVAGGRLSSTQQEDIEPLKYSLAFSGNRPSGKTSNITFYDSCGVNFDNEKSMAVYNRSLVSSRGIFLLIDPTQLTGVKEQFLLAKKPVLTADVSSILARTIKLVREGQNIQNIKQKIDIPIAVCLTKLDSVRHLLDPSSFVGYPSRHLNAPFLDRIDLESCNLEVQSLIESWGGRELCKLIQSQFNSFCFFAFSSLGAAPDDSGQLSRIAPHRVLDPLLWMLWKNSVIKCK